MEALEYLVNRADEFTNTDEENDQNRSYLSTQFLVTAGLAIGGFAYLPLFIPAGIAAIDGIVRTSSTEEEVINPGLIGHVREYFS